MTPHTLIKSYITNEDSTCIHSSSRALRTMIQHVYTRQVIHYEREPNMYTLVKSYITNEGSTYTHHGMHYERGLHIHSSWHALRTRTPHTLIVACITNEDSTSTCWAQYVDLPNPWIVLRNLWILSSRRNPWIAQGRCLCDLWILRIGPTTNHYSIAIHRWRRPI